MKYEYAGGFFSKKMKKSVAGQFAAVKCRSETYPKQCLLSTMNTVVYRYKSNKHCCVHLTNLAS